MTITRLRLALGLFGCWFALSSMADGVKFHDLRFDQAAERAASEEKVVFIDFFTTWCLPCKVMDATTFKDPDVAAWLADHTVALKVDAEANEENAALARRFLVESYPNYVYVTPDGEVLDRITGKRDPDEFVADSEAILAGENAVTRATRALAEGDRNDPTLRMALGRAYAELGRHEDALREYLWCFDEGNVHRPAFRGVRLSYLLINIIALGQSHQPA
ncbi:MAG: thioredoxin family protein, partial [Gammaproteobacteria bacterium]|nr:thioredoxin family protein [Gammaproteobacteria bacterium]